MMAAGVTSKGALAKASGVERSTVYDILTGTAHPSAATVAALAKALKQEGPVFALGDAPKPPSVSGYIGQARLALDAAERLLRDQATAPDVEKDKRHVGFAHGAGAGKVPRKPRRVPPATGTG